MQPSASKESLNARKESRARQQQDFRAFVQAQKKIHHPADDGTDNSIYTASEAVGTEETQVAGVNRGGKVPAFTPQSQRADHRHNGDVSEHGSLASVSSYSVPTSSQDSQSSPEYPQKPPPSALQIKVPHPHSHAHNHKIKPAAEAPSAAPKSSVAKNAHGANKGKVVAGPSSVSSSSKVPQRKGVSSSVGSVASSARSSPASAYSPRNTPAAAGFNVEEFRSQREAERMEMRQLMQDRRKQLHAQRGADSSSLPATPVGFNTATDQEVSEDAEIAVLVPAKPPKQQQQHYHFEPPPIKSASPHKDVDTSMGASLKYTLDTAAIRGNVDDSYEQSRIFAHLETGTQAVQSVDPVAFTELCEEGGIEDDDDEEEELLLEQAFAQQLLDEQGGADDLGLTASNDFEYSVLIEQMQQILRKPSVISSSKTHTNHVHVHAQHKPALGSIAEEGPAGERTHQRDKNLPPGRALAGELMFEGGDDEEEELAGERTEEVFPILLELRHVCWSYFPKRLYCLCTGNGGGC